LRAFTAGVSRTATRALRFKPSPQKQNTMPNPFALLGSDDENDGTGVEVAGPTVTAPAPQAPPAAAPKAKPAAQPKADKPAKPAQAAPAPRAAPGTRPSLHVPQAGHCLVPFPC
jgi:hypothetical protein